MVLPVVTGDTFEMVEDLFKDHSSEDVFKIFFETLKEENPGLGLYIEAHAMADDPAKVSQAAGMMVAYQMLRVQDIANSVPSSKIT